MSVLKPVALVKLIAENSAAPDHSPNSVDSNTAETSQQIGSATVDQQKVAPPVHEVASKEKEDSSTVPAPSSTGPAPSSLNDYEETGSPPGVDCSSMLEVNIKVEFPDSDEGKYPSSIGLRPLSLTEEEQAPLATDGSWPIHAVYIKEELPDLTVEQPQPSACPPLSSVQQLKPPEKGDKFDQKYEILSRGDGPDEMLRDAREKHFKCTECDFILSSALYLKRHISSVHRKLKPHKCLECDYAASLQGTLKKHILAVHAKVKPHKCSECDYAATQKGYLRNHVLSVHRNLKHYKCTECSYAAVQLGNLQKHIASVHKKLKPHKCAECSYAAVQLGDLQKHVSSVHMKLKPFKCAACDYAATRQDSLKRHITVVHKNIIDEAML